MTSLRERLNEYVNFEGDFERAEEIGQPQGADLVELLTAPLQTAGYEIQRAEWVDYEQEMVCQREGSVFVMGVGVEPFSERWSIMLEKGTAANPQAMHEFLSCVDDILQSSQDIRDVRWFPNFPASEYHPLLPASSGPLMEPEFYDKLPTILKWEAWLDRWHTWMTVGLFISIVIAALALEDREAAGILSLVWLGFTIGAPIVMSMVVESARKRKLAKAKSASVES